MDPKKKTSDAAGGETPPPKSPPELKNFNDFKRLFVRPDDAEAAAEQLARDRRKLEELKTMHGARWVHCTTSAGRVSLLCGVVGAVSLPVGGRLLVVSVRRVTMACPPVLAAVVVVLWCEQRLLVAVPRPAAGRPHCAHGLGDVEQATTEVATVFAVAVLPIQAGCVVCLCGRCWGGWCSQLWWRPLTVPVGRAGEEPADPYLPPTPEQE